MTDVLVSSLRSPVDVYPPQDLQETDWDRKQVQIALIRSIGSCSLGLYQHANTLAEQALDVCKSAGPANIMLSLRIIAEETAILSSAIDYCRQNGSTITAEDVIDERLSLLVREMPFARWLRSTPFDRIVWLLSLYKMNRDDSFMDIVNYINQSVRPIKSTHSCKSSHSTGSSTTNQTAANILIDCLRDLIPLCQGEECLPLIQLLANELESPNSVDTAIVKKPFSQSSDFENILSAAVFQWATRDSFLYESIANIVEGSSPALPLNNRCIQSTLAMAELVVATIIHFESMKRKFGITLQNTDKVSFLWKLIRCTPKSLVVNCGPEALDLDRQLDEIQSALTMFDICQPYVSSIPDVAWFMPGLSMNPGSSLQCRKYIDINRIESQSLLLRVQSLLQATSLPSIHECRGDVRTKRVIEMIEVMILHMSAKLRKQIESSNDISLVSQKCCAFIKDLSEIFSIISSFAENNRRDIDLFDMAKERFLCMSLVCIAMSERFDLLSSIGDYILQSDATASVRRNEEMNHASDEGSDQSNSLGEQVLMLLLQVDSYQVIVREIFYSSCRDIVDSISTSLSDDIDTASKLLKVAEFCGGNDMNVLISSERKFLTLLQTLRQVHVDVVPLQMRLKPPIELAETLLQQYPTIITDLTKLTTKKSNIFSRLVHQSDLEAVLEEGQDAVIARARSSDIPGSIFVDMILSYYDSQSNSIQEKIFLQMDLHRLLLPMAISSGDAVAIYKLARMILDNFDKLDESKQVSCFQILQEILFELQSNKFMDIVRQYHRLSIDNSTKLCHVLHDDLVIHMVANMDESYLSKNISIFSTRPASEAVDESVNYSNDNLDLAEKAVHEYLATYTAYESSISKEGKRRNLISKSLSSSIEMIHESSSSFIKQQMIRVMNYFACCDDNSKKAGIFHRIYRSIEEKINESMTYEQDNDLEDQMKMIVFDESILQQLQKKGFSKNGSRRAIYAVLKSSDQSLLDMTIPKEKLHGLIVSASLKWAIENCHRSDFDNPFVFHVQGSLLDAERPFADIDVLMKALDKLQQLAKIVCGSQWEERQFKPRPARTIQQSTMTDKSFDTISQTSKISTVTSIEEDNLAATDLIVEEIRSEDRSRLIQLKHKISGSLQVAEDYLVAAAKSDNRLDIESLTGLTISSLATMLADYDPNSQETNYMAVDSIGRIIEKLAMSPDKEAYSFIDLFLVQLPGSVCHRLVTTLHRYFDEFLSFGEKEASHILSIDEKDDLERDNDSDRLKISWTCACYRLVSSIFSSLADNRFLLSEAELVDLNAVLATDPLK